MKPLFVCLILLSFSVPVLAEEGKEFKLPDFSKVSRDLKEREKEGEAKVSCQTSTGMTVNSDEKGFDQCMIDNSNTSTQRPKEMNQGQNNNNSGSSVGFSKKLIK